MEPIAEIVTETNFAHFDGDDIGPRLELLLLDGKINDARSYSQSIHSALSAVIAILKSHEGVDVIVAGGDDIVISWPREKLKADQIEAARREFHEKCGQTMSVGIGHSTQDAIHNLQRAKLMGKDRIVSTALGPS